MVTAVFTAPPPTWVEISSASILLPSSSSRKELSAFSMLMRSMRSLPMMAMVSIIAPPMVRAFIAAPHSVAHAHWSRRGADR